MRVPAEPKRVLVVDDDRDIAEVVQTILIDEGFKVSCLYVASADEVKATIDELKPDCVLLDGGNPAAYGPSWDIAAWLAKRPRPIPAVMLTAQTADRDEAVLDETERAKAAQMAGVIGKPFDIDHLITLVHTAVGDMPAATDRQEDARVRALLAALREAGAKDVEGSKIGRVWATFRIGADLYKIYRWRAVDAYFIGVYGAGGDQLRPLGQFATLGTLIAFCERQIRGGGLS